jgi:4-diphosphocytidyl-2-C-methyl-D-erythritol kinase
MRKEPRNLGFVKAYAKINLYLEINKKLSNGYHEIDSLIAFTDIYDTLTFKISDKIKLKIIGPHKNQFNELDNNLIIKAARFIQDILNTKLGVEITLNKKIPIAAGLGGGSSNAATTILQCIDLWQPNEKITIDNKQIAYALGADVPIFLNARSSIIKGIGDSFKPLSYLPASWILIINPNVQIITKDIFTSFTGPYKKNNYINSTDQIIDFSSFVFFLKNRENSLTNTVIKKNPIVKEVLDELNNTDAAKIVRMSGSGPSCFALYSNKQEMDIAYNYIKNKKPLWWLKKSALRVKIS